MNIFVGNLLFETTQEDLKKLFLAFGEVSSVVIVMSKEKRAPKSRGFGFVEMPDEPQARSAIQALNGRQFMGRALKVNPAHPKTEAYRAQSLKKEGHPKLEARPRGAYGGGRRTRSYLKQQALAGKPEEFKPRRKSQQDNPLRWRKNKHNQRPWQKSTGEGKPWEKKGKAYKLTKVKAKG